MIPKPTPPKPTVKKVPKPEYRNAKLEQRINKNKNQSEIQLDGQELTDQDMQIVSYYAIQENNVSENELS